MFVTINSTEGEHMAAAKTARKAPAKAKGTAAKKAAPRKVEIATTATLGVDDKRAQYARLVIFNHGVKAKLISKDKDVNSVSKADLEKAGKDLNGGNLLHGKDGLELIASYSKAGATDEKVASRGLTPAYAAEVRPFIRRLLLSDTFGRRGKKAEEKTAKKAPAKAKAAPAEPAGNPPESTTEA